MTYYIYIIYSGSIDRYYLGYSSDPWRRLNQHLENAEDKYTGKASSDAKKGQVITTHPSFVY